MSNDDITPTEAKYKGDAEETYVTYDLEQETSGEGTATYPKVKRVYMPGEVQDWEVGTFEKQSGKEVYGVKITYTKEREGYEAERGDTEYEVDAGETTYTKIVEIPEGAENVMYRGDQLPEKYESALQNVS